MSIKKSLILIIFLLFLFPLTACDMDSKTTTTAAVQYLDWPDDLLAKFPAWHELDGMITEINNRSEGTEAYEINYIISAKIDGDYQLVLDYILRCENDGYSQTDQLHEWSSAYDDIHTILETECTVYEGFYCNGPWFSIDIGTGTSAMYVSVIYAWGDASLEN